jgi:uncharacterized protein YndB with AHSA1/START domain
MPHEFEVREEITLEATPEQIWQAIATGPGIDSWFMGRNEVEPRPGGRTRMSMPGFTAEGTVTVWEPGKQFAYRSDENPDGTFMAFEYLIEGRDGGSTVLRFVHSGLLGDDWETEYDALRVGDRMYLRKLAIYVKHFAGRTATYTLFAPGPRVADDATAWSAFERAAGLTGTAAEGDRARITVDGLPADDGVVEIANHPSFLAVRTGSGLYMFIHGYQHMVVVEYQCFAEDVDGQRIERAWQAWLATLPTA